MAIEGFKDFEALLVFYLTSFVFDCFSKAFPYGEDVNLACSTICF